jgi:hypothetical protein
VEPPPEADDRAPLEVRRSWARRSAELATKPHPEGVRGEPAVLSAVRRDDADQRRDRRAAVVRHILGHLGIALPSSAYRSPPVRMTPDSCGEAAHGLAVSEVPEGTYEPVEDDLPPLDPLAV